MKDGGHLGANIDFDYLGDDDDDDATGGAPGDTFNVTVVADETSVSGGGTFGVIATAQATGSTQTNGAFRILISATNNDVADNLTPSTVALDGWSETGWTFESLSHQWFNDFTLASVAVGTDAVSIDITYSADHAGVIVISTATPPPDTDSATGAGNSTGVTVTA